MDIPIEQKIIAIIEADAFERLPALVSAHLKQDKAPAIQWGTKDEFGQPILFRIIESADFDVVSDLLEHIEGANLAVLRFATFSHQLLPFQRFKPTLDANILLLLHTGTTLNAMRCILQPFQEW